MKKIISILLLILTVQLSACASKEPPFEFDRVFKEAEENMQRESFEKARKQYQEIQEKSPDKSYDAFLMLRVADTYFGEEKYSEAAVEYRAFLNYHPVHRDAAYAQYQIAMCSYNDLSTIDRDPAPAYAVVKEMNRLLEKYPRSGYEDQARKYIAICREWISDYELYVARFYYKQEAYQAVVGRCEKLLKDFPETPAEKDALYYAGMSYAELGEKARARAAFEKLTQKYPAMKTTALAQIKKLQMP